jgi:hypothetical protein
VGTAHVLFGMRGSAFGCLHDDYFLMLARAYQERGSLSDRRASRRGSNVSTRHPHSV